MCDTTLKGNPLPLRFESAGLWGEWLNQNGKTEREAWVLIRKKHSRLKGMDLATAVEEAICHGWIDGKLLTVDGESFMLRFTPRRPDSIWSEINRDRAMKLIKEGRMTDAGMETVKSAKESGWWSKPATNLRKERIPPDLRRAMLAEGRSLQNFEKLSNSHRNQFIVWVNEAKLRRTREDRIRKVVEQTSRERRANP